MIDKIDAIYNAVIKEEYKQVKTEDEEETDYDVLGNYDYFKDIVDEAFEQYEMLHDELISAWSVVEPVKDEDEYWVEPDRVRIIYYFD